MSAGYGKYLTEEDLNKKKQEGTTPSTTPTTAAGGTTTPPLTYEGFVGTGSGSQAYQTNVGYVNNQYNASVDAANTNKETGTQYAQAQKDSIYGAAKTNKELGMSYAEGVKNSIYGNAAAQRAEADKSIEAARQRGIIDSQSSYQKAVGVYGSNAETLAGRGLSGSGYGEYLTADAYATHRGQVQNINADALRANREAAYAENQAKMAADSEYLKNLYGINTEYNKAVSGADSEYLKNLYGINTEYNAAMNKAESDRTTGMYQAALGLNQDQNAAYGKLFDSASKGVSIDAIMQDGTWGDLTPEQQQAITAEAERFANDKSVNEFKGLIDGGTSLEDIQKSEAWSKLTDAQKTDVTNYYNNKTQGATDEQNYINDTNFGNWVTDLSNGKATLDQIKAMSGYDKLTDAQKGQLQTAENNRVAKSGLADKTERADRIVTYGDLARGGMSLDELKATMALYGDDWDNLDPKEQKVIQMAADAYTAAQKKLESEDRPNQIAGLADLAAKGYSIDEIKQWAEIYGITNLGENELAVIQSSADRYAAAQEKLNSENEMDRALGYVGLLEAGWTLKDVKALIGTEAWNAMGDEAKTMITQSSKVIGNLKTEAAGKDAKGALEAYIKAAGEGLSIDALTAIAMANGHYDVLVGEKGTEEGKTLWDSVVAEANKLTNQNATNDTLTNIEDAINDGATLDEIKEMPGYDELDDNVKEEIGEQVTERDEQIEALVDYVVEEVNYNEISSIDDLNSFLNSYSDAKGNLLSKDMKERVVAKWTSNNTDNDIKQIGEAKIEEGKLMIDGVEITGAMLAQDIKNGVYGDRGDEVVKKYSQKLADDVRDLTWTLAQFDALDVDATNYLKSKTNIKTGLNRENLANGNTKIYGIEFKSKGLVKDSASLDYLNSLSTSQGTYVRVGNDYYYKVSSLAGAWVRLERINNPSTSVTQR